jgi:hypothetical protein
MPLIPLTPLVPWCWLVLLGSLVPLGSLDIAIMYDWMLIIPSEDKGEVDCKKRSCKDSPDLRL